MRFLVWLDKDYMFDVSSFIYSKCLFPDLVQTSDFENINLNLFVTSLWGEKKVREPSLLHVTFIVW